MQETNTWLVGAAGSWKTEAGGCREEVRTPWGAAESIRSYMRNPELATVMDMLPQG